MADKAKAKSAPKKESTSDPQLSVEVGGEAFGISGEGLVPGPVHLEVIWPGSISQIDATVGEDGLFSLRGRLPEGEGHRGSTAVRLFTRPDPDDENPRTLLASASADYKE